MSQFFRNTDAFVKQSGDILSIFNKTITRLEKLNNKMKDSKDEILGEIKSREQEVATIDETLKNNNRIMKNISNLLS